MIQREDVTVHDASTTEDICRDQRTFVAELRLRTAYAVTGEMYRDIRHEWIETELRSQIMRHIYGDLPGALAVLETALGVAGHRDGFGSPVKDALDILRSHVATITGGEGAGR